MNQQQYKLDSEAVAALSGIERGIEKEGLRVSQSLQISQQPHLPALGSTLTHPYITTDYSEALLEFITPKQGSITGSIDFLSALHAFTYDKIGDELIWPASMPSLIQGEASIPIAVYGNSNVGMMKHIYRRGLDVRYGRIMQAIAGIHYNMSLPHDFWAHYHAQTQSSLDFDEFRSQQYFHLIRNFQRHSWLLYYLFGASPVLHESFFDGRSTTLEKYGEHTYGAEYATSLRMSDLGYTNSAQQDLYIKYDSLHDYINTLSHAVHQPYAAYQALGIKDEHGEYIQLNANILQIENEYYSEIRPKRVTHSGERPVQALQRGGVEYIEVRALDINPYLPVGIDAQQCRFIDAFMLYCLLSSSARQCPNEWQEIAANRQTIISEGRKPGLQLEFCQQRHSVSDWVNKHLDGIYSHAELLDQAWGDNSYSKAVAAQQIKATDPNATPSGQLMQEILAGKEFLQLSQSLAMQHRQLMNYQHLEADQQVHLEDVAKESMAAFNAREQAEEVSFDDYLSAYNEL